MAHFDSPSIALDGGLHIPEDIPINQNIDIKFSAEQIRTKDSDPLYPHLRLKRVVLSLHGFTEVLCWYPDHSKGPQSVRHMHKDAIASRVYTDVGPHDGMILKLDGSSHTIARKWNLAEFAAKAQLVPDFTSSLTIHRHSLSAHIEPFHEESSHTMKLDVEVPVKILPAFVPPPEEKPQKSKPRPGSLYAPSEGRYSVELPVYSASPGTVTYAAEKMVAATPVPPYTDLAAPHVPRPTIPPREELPRVLRVANPSG